jgi:methyl-accepting chemotaxis protein
MSWRLSDALKLVQARLGVRLALVGSALAVAPLLLLSGALAFGARRAMTQQVHGTLLAEAQGFATALETSLFERDRNVLTWAQDPVLLAGLASKSYDQSSARLVELVNARHPLADRDR